MGLGVLGNTSERRGCRQPKMESSAICWTGWVSILCSFLSFPLGSRKDSLGFAKTGRGLLTACRLLFPHSDASNSQNISPQLQACGIGKLLISLRERGAQSRYFNIFQFSRGKPEHGCCCQGNHLLPPSVLCIRVSLHLLALQGNIIAPCLGEGF